jgi:hypothetical protein
MIPILKLCWTAAKRQLGGLRGLIAICGGAAAVRGFHTLGQQPANPAVYHDGLFVVGIATVLVVPLFLRDNDVLRSSRLRLLPLSRGRLVALRLVVGRPLRTLLAAVVLFWGSWAAVALHGALGGGAVALRIAAWLLMGITAMDLLEHFARRYFAALFEVAVLMAGGYVMPLFIFYPMGAPEVTFLLGSLPEWLREILLPSRAPLAPYGGAVSLLFTLLITGLLVVVGQRRIFDGAPRVSPGLYERFTIASARLIPLGPTLQKELASLTRLYFARILHGMAIAICAFAAYLGAWWLLPAASLGWITLAHNLLGGDDPLAGRIRYRIAPVSLFQVLRARHTALFLIAGIVLLGGALAGALLHPGTGVVRWVAGAVLGVAIVCFTTLTGDWFSVAHTKPIGLREVMLGGGYVASISFLGVAATYLACAAVVLGIFVVLQSRELGSLPHLAVATCLLGAGVLGAAYAVGARLFRKRHAD